MTIPTTGVADPGPSSGRLPTNPLLVNGPVVDRGLLEQQFPAGAVIRNPSTVYLDNPDLKLPTSRQLTLGYQRQFPANVALAADYIHTWGSGDVVPFDLNPGVRANTSRTGSITRVDLLGLAGTLGLTPFTRSVITFRNNNARVDPSYYDRLKTSRTIVMNTDEHDVFGDQTVILKAAPGHTPGHQVAIVRLAKTGPVMLCGDLYHYPEERTFHSDPPNNEQGSVDQTRASRQMIEEYLQKTRTTLWIEHDFVANAKLKKSPGFYE